MTMKSVPKFSAIYATTHWTPWRRLITKMLVRAVLDIINNIHTDKGVVDPVLFLTDPTTRTWSDMVGASIPWRKIDELTRRRQ